MRYLPGVDGLAVDLGAPTPALLASYAAILTELEQRGVIRTRNAPTGDYAEWLVQHALGGVLEKNSTKSHDVTTADGSRLQVKCRVVSTPIKPGERQLSVIRSWDFDQLAIVLLDRASFGVLRAVLAPADVVRSVSVWIKHVNGFRVDALPNLLDHPATIDVTERLRVASLDAVAAPNDANGRTQRSWAPSGP